MEESYDPAAINYGSTKPAEAKPATKKKAKPRKTQPMRGEGAEANTVAADQLRSLIERIERLEEEKATIAEDIKQVFAEAKGSGFDTKAMRSLLKIRKRDAAELAEEHAVLDLYMNALGMLPLFGGER